MPSTVAAQAASGRCASYVLVLLYSLLTHRTRCRLRHSGLVTRSGEQSLRSRGVMPSAMACLHHIQWEDLEIVEHCGSGTFGAVYRASWKSAGVEVAVKKVLALGNEVRRLRLLCRVTCSRDPALPPTHLLCEPCENAALQCALSHEPASLAGVQSIKHISPWQLDEI